MGMMIPFHQIFSAIARMAADLKKSFIGATTAVAGSMGMVPAPTTADLDKFLVGGGGWRFESFRGAYSTTKDYVSGTFCVANGVLVYCNADVLKTTGFVWGSSGATWTPHLEATLVFQGLYGGTVNYSAKSVVAISNSQGLLYRSLIDNNLGKAITDTTAWLPFSPTLDLTGLKSAGTGTGSNVSTTPSVVMSKMLIESVQVFGTAITGTPQLAMELANGLVIVHTVAPSTNWTINIVSSALVPLNTVLAIGQCVTFTHLVQMGSTAYMPTSVSVDGLVKTELWALGTKPTAGIASAMNCYSYTIIKTADQSFLVLADQSSFK
jgi:hypothetical protein